MKAKEYAEKLFELVENHEEFENLLEKCLKELCAEADSLIKVRRAKSDEAVAACINQVNQKYMAIINQYDKLIDKEYQGWKTTMCPTLLTDGFKAAYVHMHPNRGWYFDIKRHKQFVDEENARREDQQRWIAAKTLMPYVVTPYDQLTMETLVQEIMACLAALGHYAEMGMPIQSLRPLAFRIALLRYWKENGAINLDDVKAMESYDDPSKFFEERGFILP